MRKLAITGNRASGRSTALVAAIVMQAVQANSNILVVSHAGHNNAYIQNKVRHSLVDESLVHDKPNYMVLANGSKIWYRLPSDDYGKGVNLDLLAVDNLDLIPGEKLLPLVIATKSIIYTMEDTSAES